MLDTSPFHVQAASSAPLSLSADLSRNDASAAPFSVIAGGSGNVATHSNAILLGSNLRSDHPFQIKIGVGDEAVSFDLNREDYVKARAGIFSMLRVADMWKPG